MSKHFLTLLAGLIVAGTALPAAAQSHAGHGAHAQGNETPMAGMDHADMPEMEPAGATQTMAPGDMAGMSGMADMSQNSSEMQMQMQMQGGSAPPDARDPDAYSDGFRRNDGPYSLGPDHQSHMADQHNFGAIRLDRLEAVHSAAGRSNAYEAQAWFGNTYNKLVVKSEGEISRGRVHEARNELLWGHAVSTYFDTQLGIRNDFGSGRPGRNWLALGVQGLAPYWFEVEATAYVSNQGRTALRLAAEYELLLTQRLILQPRVEANLYGRSDPRTETGSGLANTSVGLRLRYEFSRQFAPYVGVEQFTSHGATADLVRAAAGRGSETRLVAGLRMWF